MVRAGALRVITALRLLSPLSPALYNQQQLRKKFCAACMSGHTQSLSDEQNNLLKCTQP